MDKSLESIISTKLELLKSIEGVQLWEYKTFTIHRGVVSLRLLQRGDNVSTLKSDIRQLVLANYKRSWWRGFGFGAIVYVSNFTASEKLEELYELIDTRDNKKGAWQWLMLIDKSSKEFTCVHMHMKGYLSSIFMNVIEFYENQGFVSTEK